MISTPPTELGTILSIWAHPDDETYLAGGIMAAARDNGQRVVCASATAGEHGTDDPATWPPDRLGQVRRWEATAALAVLGVHEHHILGVPDGSAAEHQAAGVAWAEHLLHEARPDAVLTFGPDGMTYHPDHIAVHHWVTRAWHVLDRPCRLLYAVPTVEHLHRFGALYEDWNMYMSDERPTGIPEADAAVHVRLQRLPLDRKLTALRVLATQTAGVMAAVDPRIYAAEVAEECFVDAPTGRADRSGHSVHRLRR